MTSSYSLIPSFIPELFFYAMCIWFAYLGGRLVRVSERRADAPEGLENLVGRVQLLEESVEQVRARVDRTAESQEFMDAVLLGASRPDRLRR